MLVSLPIMRRGPSGLLQKCVSSRVAIVRSTMLMLKAGASP